MTIEIEPKLLSPGDIDALIREAEALPDINKGLWTHNERELIGFCQRLAEALAGEHLLRRPDITGAAPPDADLFPDAPPHHDYMQRLMRRADAAIVNLRDLEDNCDTDCAAEIAAIEELREALKRELRMRRSKAAPQNPHADAAVSKMSPLELKIFDVLANYGLTETRYDEDGAYPLIDALTLTDESIAQGRREAAALAEHLAAELEEWSAARLAENAAMKVVGCGAASGDPAEFQHRPNSGTFSRAKMEAAIDEEVHFFRGGKDAKEWTNRRTAAAFRAENAIFGTIEAGCGPVAAAAGAVAAAAKIGGGFTDHSYLMAELTAALRTGLAAAPKFRKKSGLPRCAPPKAEPEL